MDLYVWYNFYGENMNRIATKVLIIVYLTIAIAITIHLFMFNRFNTSSIGNRIVFSSKNLKSFKDGSLVIIRKNINNIDVGDYILFYNVYTTKEKIYNEKVISKEKTNEKEYTFEVENNRFVSSSYVLGKNTDAKIIPFIGKIVMFLSSTLGYLFFILLPILSLFVIQLRQVIKKYNLWGFYD